MIEFKDQSRMADWPDDFPNPMEYKSTTQFDRADTGSSLLDITDVLVSVEDARGVGAVLHDLEDAEVCIARSGDVRKTAELAATRAARDLGLSDRPTIRYFEPNRKRAFSFVGLANAVDGEIWIAIADRPLAKMAGTVMHEVAHVAGYDEPAARAYGDSWANYLDAE